MILEEYIATLNVNEQVRDETKLSVWAEVRCSGR